MDGWGVGFVNVIKVIVMCPALLLYVDDEHCANLLIIAIIIIIIITESTVSYPQ